MECRDCVVATSGTAPSSRKMSLYCPPRPAFIVYLCQNDLEGVRSMQKISFAEELPPRVSAIRHELSSAICVVKSIGFDLAKGIACSATKPFAFCPRFPRRRSFFVAFATPRTQSRECKCENLIHLNPLCSPFSTLQTKSQLDFSHCWKGCSCSGEGGQQSETICRCRSLPNSRHGRTKDGSSTRERPKETARASRLGHFSKTFLRSPL